MSTERHYLAEQFDDVGQQRHADFLGMWLFLATELLLFGGVFMGFAINRFLHPQVFGDAAHELDLVLGGINTAILLTSGLTMALAEQAVVLGRKRLTLALMSATLALGVIFLFIKGMEYHKEYSEQLLPITGFVFAYDGPAQAQMFFNFYFVMTFMHALHMAIGLAIIAVLIGIGRGWKRPDRFERQVHVVGLYWAFVDIVWVFVFTSLYLLRS